MDFFTDVSSILSTLAEIIPVAGIIIALVLSAISARPIDINVLMTSKEQIQNSILRFLAAVIGFIFIELIVSYSLSINLIFGENKDWCVWAVIISFLFLNVIVVAVTVCEKLRKRIIENDQLVNIVLVALILLSLLLVSVYSVWGAGIIKSIIIDAYTSFIFVFGIAQLVKSSQTDLYYVYLNEKDGETDKWVVYRKINDKEILCGKSEAENDNEIFKIVPFDKIKMIEKCTKDSASGKAALTDKLETTDNKNIKEEEIAKSEICIPINDCEQ